VVEVASTSATKQTAEVGERNAVVCRGKSLNSRMVGNPEVTNEAARQLELALRKAAVSRIKAIKSNLQ
jgi:hypothetical protein